MSSALYRGAVIHARTDHLARRSFRYPVFMAAIDLAELPLAHLRLFSHDGTNLFSLHDRDYADGARGLAAAHRDLLAKHHLPAPVHTRLVTNLRVLGYVFNPVSFFLGYDARGDLETVVAEVNNTYGGRHRYVLGPRDRISPDTFRCARDFFVSPFLHGDRTYAWKLSAPLDGRELAITMHVDTPAGDRVLTAHLAGTRQELTDRALVAAALRYPLMTAQVIGAIHYEALKLRYLHGVPYRRPDTSHRPLPE